MGTEALTSVSNGEVASEDKWNQIKRAMAGDIYPRNSTSFLLEDLSGKIGNSTYRFNNAHAKQFYADYFSVSRTNVVSGSSVNIGNNERLLITENITEQLTYSGQVAMSETKSFTIITDGSLVEVSTSIKAPTTVDSNFQYIYSLYHYTHTSELGINFDLYKGMEYHLFGSYYRSAYAGCGFIMWLPAGTYTLYEYAYGQVPQTVSRIMQIRKMVI